MRQAWRTSLALAVVLVVVVGGVAVAVLVSLSAVRSSDHRWCTTLTLLTAEPVPRPASPTADPSRQRAYVFYIHLKDLEREFGC